MNPLNYNITQIKEYELGDVKIPLFFSLKTIKAFNKDTPASKDGKYLDKLKMNEFKTILFEHVLLEEFKLELDFIQLFSENYKADVDYIIKQNHIIINSKEAFYEVLLHLIDSYGLNLNNILMQLSNLIYSSELELTKVYEKRVFEDLALNKKNDMAGNSTTHMLGWMLGETATNQNPMFEENIGKPTMDWSYREVVLRNRYRDKCFMIEIAKEKYKAKLMEDAKKKNKK